MANQPHTTSAPAANTAAPPAAPPPSPVPGGMASDPAVALATELFSSMKGSADRKEEPDIGSIAQTIRRFVDAEVAKVTAGGSGLHANIKASEK